MLAKKLTDLIKIYDDAVNPETCAQTIKLFERYSDYHERFDTDKKPAFTQMNLTSFTRDTEDYSSKDKDLHQHLVNTFTTYASLYCTDLMITDEHPPQYALEELRIKRYTPADDEFQEHVDVGNHNSARRYLAFFLYLNEVESGETKFPYLNLTVEPKPGRLVIFPPLWMFPHAGLPCGGDIPKYIVGSYCHYL